MFKNLILEPSQVTDYFAVKGISNSSMGRINPLEGGSPRKYQGYIANSVEFKSKATELGKKLHMYSLEKDKFLVGKVPKPDPTTKAGKYADAWIEFMTADSFAEIRTNAGLLKDEAAHRHARKTADYAERYGDDFVKAEFKKLGEAYALERIKAMDKIFLTQDESRQLTGMENSFKNHPIINKYLFESEPDWIVYNELPIITNMEVGNMFDGEVVQLMIKGKLDRIIIDPVKKRVLVIDVKTDGSSLHSFPYNFRQMRYYRQAAFYRNLLRLTLDITLEEWTFEYKNYVVETNGIFECGIFNVSEEWILKGTTEYTNLLSRLAYHIQNDDWTYSIEELQSENREIELLIPSYI